MLFVPSVEYNIIAYKVVRDCASVAMGVTGGSMWNAPPSKRRNCQMFTFVKNAYTS